MNLKELIQYITNNLKFWVIIREWEAGVHLRCGKIRKSIRGGIYFKIPLLDSFFVQPIRVQELHGTHINALTKDQKDITVSYSVWYKITDVKDFYNTYSEPNEIIAAETRSVVIRHIAWLQSKDINACVLEDDIKPLIIALDKKGFKFTDFKMVTISKANTYRLIQDKLYAQNSNNLDSERY